jgi:Ca-activated chloride channel homolog
VLVVLTDGEDNSSRTSLKQAIRNAEATGVTVYAISTNSHEGPKSDADKILLELAERSGGSATFPDSLMALNRIFDKLQDAIRSRYLVAYKPADFVPNGAYRPISIAAAQNGERLQVHARKGYHARLASPPVSR